MPTEAPDDEQDPNVNDIVYSTPTRKIEYDKSCFGPRRWVIFSRAHTRSQWLLMAEAESYEEAKQICDDDDRIQLGTLQLTEVERMKKAKP